MEKWKVRTPMQDGGINARCEHRCKMAVRTPMQIAMDRNGNGWHEMKILYCVCCFCYVFMCCCCVFCVCVVPGVLCVVCCMILNDFYYFWCVLCVMCHMFPGHLRLEDKGSKMKRPVWICYIVFSLVQGQKIETFWIILGLETLTRNFPVLGNLNIKNVSWRFFERKQFCH